MATTFQRDRKRLGTAKALAIYSAAQARRDSLRIAAMRAKALAPWLRVATPRTRLGAALTALVAHGLFCALGAVALHFVSGGALDVLCLQLGATFTVGMSILSFAGNDAD